MSEPFKYCEGQDHCTCGRCPTLKDVMGKIDEAVEPQKLFLKHHFTDMAVTNSAKVIFDHFASKECDSDSVSACIKCNAVFLAKVATLLADERRKLAVTVARYAEQWENKPETIEVDQKALVELVKDWRRAMHEASRGFRRDEREWTDIYANGVNAGKALALGRCIDELEIVIKSGPTQNPCYGIS